MYIPVSFWAWHICITISSSVRWWWRTTRGGALCVWLRGCWVEKTLFWLAVLISCGADKDSLWAWRALVGPLLPCHDSSKWQPLKRSKLSAYLHCCPQLLTSTATSQSHKLHWLWSSHVSHSRLTFHQPLRTAALTTTTTCTETNCPLPLPFILLSASLGCQWQFKLYLFSAQDINRKGIFPPAFQKWMEFSCSVLDFSRGWVWFMKRRYCIIYCCPVR